MEMENNVAEILWRTSLITSAEVKPADVEFSLVEFRRERKEGFGLYKPDVANECWSIR